MTSTTRLRENNTQRISREDHARNEPAHSGGVGYHTMGLCESVNGGGEKDLFLTLRGGYADTHRRKSRKCPHVLL